MIGATVQWTTTATTGDVDDHGDSNKWTTTATTDDVDDHGNSDNGDGATVQQTTTETTDVVDDHGDSDNGNGATVQRTTTATTIVMARWAQCGRRRVINRTINLPFDMKLVMYSQSRAPPSMRAQQGSLNEMLRPAALSVLSFPT
jgi:hypothetical protein